MKYILPIILGVALLSTVVWGYYQYDQKLDYHTYLDLQFQRQFYDLIGHVENAQVDLAKAMVSGSNLDMSQFFNSVAMQSYLAQEKLTQLPFDHGSIRKTEKFLSQMGDYCTAMANKSIEGIILDEEELNTLQQLHKYANYLSQQLAELQQQIVENGVNFGDLRREGNRKLDLVSDQMGDLNLINIEERMQEYPELIYDGPFSEHLRDIKPRLEGSTVNDKQAIEAFLNKFGEYDITDANVIYEIENTGMDAYYIQAIKDGNGEGQEVTAAVTKTGGKIIWYIDPRPIAESKLGREEAVEKAENFLRENNYDNMVSTYAMAYEGQIVINFAYEQDNVIIYSDLIKVKVALDNGDIIGFEADGYLRNHQKRDIQEPEISEEEARQRLSSAVKVESSRLAMIPTAGKNEILCYEFKISFGPDRYLVYIDAETGRQRKLLLLVEQGDGTLII